MLRGSAFKTRQQLEQEIQTAKNIIIRSKKQRILKRRMVFMNSANEDSYA